jgi:DNA repair photolyase
VLIAPLMPGINDAPDQVARIVERATDAGAAYVTGIALHLRGDVKGLFFGWLERQRPDLLPRYRDLYRRGAYAPQEERRRLAALVRGPDLPPGERMRGNTGHAQARASPAREPEQRALF